MMLFVLNLIHTTCRTRVHPSLVNKIQCSYNETLNGLGHLIILKDNKPY